MEPIPKSRKRLIKKLYKQVDKSSSPVLVVGSSPEEMLLQRVIDAQWALLSGKDKWNRLAKASEIAMKAASQQLRGSSNGHRPTLTILDDVEGGEER